MKKFICLLTAIIMAISVIPVSADKNPQESAEALYSLGLFRGSDTGFELEAYATRVQISVTLIRLLGKDAKAQMQKNPHPFTDVPDWAGDAIGWLYENYLVNGVTDTYFDSNAVANRQQFATMLLRALGYSDAGGWDFTYDNALYFAQTIGLTDSGENALLTRGEMVSLAYRALKLPLRNARRTLAEKLCAERIFTKEAAVAAGIMGGKTNDGQFADIPENLGTMMFGTSGTGGYILTFENPPESYGMRLYCSVDGGAYTQITGQTAISCTEFIGYKSGDAATYLDGYALYGLSSGRQYSFIALKSSSTGALYEIYGKTATLDIGL